MQQETPKFTYYAAATSSLLFVVVVVLWAYSYSTMSALGRIGSWHGWVDHSSSNYWVGNQGQRVNLLGLQAHFGRDNVFAWWEVRIRYYWLAVLFAVAPAVQLVKWRRSRRQPVGRCRRCGYDLRASPSRCPECGEVAAARPAA